MSVDGNFGTVVGKGLTTIKATYKYFDKVYTDSFVLEFGYDQLTTNEDTTLYLIETEQTPVQTPVFLIGDGEDLTSLATFVSSNPNVAIVSDGKVIALSEGTAVISGSFTFANKTYTVTFTVTVIDNTPVLSTNSETNLYLIERTDDTPVSTQLILLNKGVDVCDANGVYFTSSNNSIVKVENKSIVAVGEGSATITAYYPYAGNVYTASFVVNVIDNTPVITTLDDATISLYNIFGATNTLKLKLFDCGTDVSSQATFTSSNAGIASISNGVLKAVKAGNTTITGSIVIAGVTYSASFDVTVTDNTPVLTGNTNTTIYLYDFGGEVTFVNLFLNVNGTDYTNSAIFTAQNEEVVTIDGTTAVACGEGSTTITATVAIDGTVFEKSFVITVIDNTPSLKTNSDETIYLNNFDTQPNTLDIFLFFGGVNVLDNANVSISNQNVTLSGSTITARKVGTSTITFTYNFRDVVYTTSFVVTVVDNTISTFVNGESSSYVELHVNEIYGQTSATLSVSSLVLGELNVTLSSDNEEAVIVEGNKIVAVKGGSALITASYTIGTKNYSTKFEVKVIADIPALTTLDDTDLYVYGEYQGDYPISATLFLKDSNVDVTNKAQFIIEDSSIASISGTTLTALKAGTTTVSVYYEVAGVVHMAEFNVFVHGINTINDTTLICKSTGRVQGLLDATIISAKLNNSTNLTISGGVITGGLTVNVDESNAYSLFVISEEGIYSFTKVLVYDTVIFDENDFINLFKTKFTSAQVREMLVANFNKETGAWTEDGYTIETISGQIALANDIYTTKSLTTATSYSYTNDTYFVKNDGTKVTGTRSWSVLYRQFTGTFDGRGHVVSGLTFNNGYGLFGKVIGGTIKNVGFTNVRFTASLSAVLGYSADTNSTISNVLVEVEQAFGGNSNYCVNYRSGGLFQNMAGGSGSNTGTATFKDILLIYPEIATDPANYTGGTVFGWINQSAVLYSNRFTNVVVISKTIPVASYISSGNVWVAKGDSISGYNTTFVCDGGRQYTYLGPYRATITRYNTYADMLNAGNYKVGSWTYDDTVSDYVYTNSNPVVKSLGDLIMIEDSDTTELYMTVNGVKVTGATFTSNNTSIASISGSTLIANAPGSARITASYNLGGSTYTATFNVTVVAGNVVNITENTLVSIEEGTVQGVEGTIVAARQNDVQLTVVDGVITDGLFVPIEKVTTTVNGHTTTNDNVVSSTLTIFTSEGVYVFSNAYVYNKVLRTAEQAFNTFSTYNNGAYGVTTGYMALANDIDMRQLGVVRHIAEGSRDNVKFNHSFTITDANGNSVTKQLGFQGYLDGWGHYLSYNATMGGLFGRLRAGSVVKNIAFRDVWLPNQNGGDTFDNVVCFSSDAKTANVLIQDVYISVADLSSKTNGNRSAILMNQYDTNSYAFVKNVVIEVPKPTEEGDNPSYGYGVLFVRDDVKVKSSLSTAGAALENVYVITGEKMPMASLLGTTSETYAIFAGNEQVDSFVGAKTIYKYNNVLRYDSLDQMTAGTSLTALLGNEDVWTNFYNKHYTTRINGVETSVVQLYTNDAREYRDHATIYSYLNAKKINDATYLSSNENVVVYEGEKLIAKGVGSATVTITYNGDTVATISVNVKDLTIVKTQADLEKIYTKPNGIFVLEKDVVLDNLVAPENFVFTGVIYGQGQAIKGTAKTSVLGVLSNATLYGVAFKLDSGAVYTSATNSTFDNVCIVGTPDLTGVTVTNSVINYVEYDVVGDKSGFNREYWDLTFGTEWKFRATFQGTHELNYTETNNYLVNNGACDYVLILPATANSQSQLVKAYKEFIRLFKRATGITLEAYLETSTAQVVQDAIASGKYISIGDTNLFNESGIELPDNLGMDGSIIKTQGNSIYIVGGSQYGSLYGVYNFMTICFEFEAYYKDCVVINTGVENLKLYDFDVVDIPDFATRAENHGFINVSQQDYIIDGNTYSSTSTVYTDASLLASRYRETSAYREVMTVMTNKYYTEDENGVINPYSLVDEDGTITSNTDAKSVQTLIINGKSLPGASIHNTSEFFPYDSNYYTARGGFLDGVTDSWQEIYLSDLMPSSSETGSNYRMVCFTAHGDATAYNYLVQQFANKIIQSIILYANPETAHKNVIYIMNEDNGRHCPCDACMSAIDYYGSRSGAEIKFTNDVYDRVTAWLESIKDDPVLSKFYRDDFRLFYSPYGQTNPAPIKNGRPTIYARDGVGMYLCVSRTLDYSQSIYSATNDAGRNDFNFWGEITDYISTWLYSTNFGSYMTYYDTYYSHDSEAYQYYASQGVIIFSSQSQSGQDGSATAFHGLQAYVNAKLRWDSSLDVETLVENYFNAMFDSNVNEVGSSAWYMMKMYNEIRDASVEYSKQFNMYRTPSHGNEIEERAYWTVEKVARWLDYCDKAIANANEVTATSTLTGTVGRHIRTEKLFPLYIAIKLHRTEYSEADYYAMVEEFKNIVTEVGIGDWCEHETMATYLATLATAEFATPNTSGSYELGQVIDLSLRLKLSDRLNDSEAINSKYVKITSSNTNCAVVEGAKVRVVGRGVSIINVEYSAGNAEIYSYSITVACGVQQISGVYEFSAYNGEDANDEERRIDASLFDGNIVSVKDEYGNELLEANGEVNITNDTNAPIKRTVLVEDSLGNFYSLDLLVYTRFIYDADDYTKVFLNPEYVFTVNQIVLKNGATESTVVGSYSSRTATADDIGVGSWQYFKFNYEMQEGDVRLNDTYSTTAIAITGSYLLRNDIGLDENDIIKTKGTYNYNMARWGTAYNSNGYPITAASGGDNQGYKLSGSNFYYSTVAFNGTFDGGGYTIYNMVIDAEGGMFGSLVGATIKNVGIVDVTLVGSGRAVVAYKANNTTTMENIYIKVKDFGTANGFYGNRQGILTVSVANNVQGWKVTNVLIDYPQLIEINTNMGFGAVGYIAQSSGSMPVCDNLVVVSPTTYMSNYVSNRVWLAENDSSLANTTYKSFSTKRIVKGAYRYDDANAIMKAGIDKVGNWNITYLNNTMVVNWVD